MQRDDWFAFGICLLVSTVYIAFPTQNYYWDGIGYAMTIEESAGVNIKLFNPNHLLANFIGWFLYSPLHALWPPLRALPMLATLSTLASVLTSYLLFRILQRFLHNAYFSASLTLLFAFSATWWKFSTDANVYVPCVCLLVLASDLLTHPDRKQQPVLIGLLHALSMLLHQIAIFFYPAAIVALIMRRQEPPKVKVVNALTYTATAGISVVIAYLWAWFGYVNGVYAGTFWKWITANGREEWAFVSLGSNVGEALRSTVRLFFGGRFSLALEHIDGPFLAVLITMIATCAALLVAAIIKTVMEWFQDEEFLEVFPREVKTFLIAWVGSFAFFLLFWLTQFPYYRLFYLPAAVLAIGILLKRYGLFGPLRRTHVVPIFMMLLALSNFSFLIYPYSKAEASPPVHLAREAQKIWNEDVVVYYREFNGDNAIQKYFNPQTEWRRIHLDNLEAFDEEFSMLAESEKVIWMDRTALDYFENSDDLTAWLLERVDLGSSWGISDRKHQIRFVHLIPKALNERGAKARVQKPYPVLTPKRSSMR